MSIQDKIQTVVNCCQVGKYEINGNVMRFKAIDSDCEYYFDEFNIDQRTIDGETYNVIDLDNVE